LLPEQFNLFKQSLYLFLHLGLGPLAWHGDLPSELDVLRRRGPLDEDSMHYRGCLKAKSGH
jgi:hypothetical protein